MSNNCSGADKIKASRSTAMQALTRQQALSSETLKNQNGEERALTFTRQLFESQTQVESQADQVLQRYILQSQMDLNPLHSLYGSGLLVKPMSCQGHEIQHSVLWPLPERATL